MKKISIAMYSTFKRPGWKSEQLEKIVPILKNKKIFEHGYGLKTLRYKNKDKNLILTCLPILGSLVVQKLVSILNIPGYLPYLFGEYAFGFLLAKKIGGDKSDIVYCKPRPLSIIKASKQNNKKIIMEFGEMHPNFTANVLREEYKKFSISEPYIYTSHYAIDQSLKAIELADIIIVLSEASKKSFIDNGVLENKLRVIGLGLQNRKNIGYESDKPFAFVTTGFHSFVKGTHRLLLAWKAANLVGHELIVVGKMQADMIEFVKANGPFENVKFVGHQCIDKFYSKYNAVGILNSLSEGYPRSVLEYMQFSFPVIVSPVATCDLVVNGKHGFIVSSDYELVDRIKFFAGNIQAVIEMGIQAKIAVSNLKAGYYEDSLLTLIEEVSDAD